MSYDPTIRGTNSEKKVANLSVETKLRNSEFHRVICWDELADRVERLKKGSFIQVKGRLQTRSFEQDGQKKRTTEIVAAEIVSASEKPPITPNMHGVAITDDDIGF